MIDFEEIDNDDLHDHIRRLWIHVNNQQECINAITAWAQSVSATQKASLAVSKTLAERIDALTHCISVLERQRTILKVGSNN